jgi:hypothetical protein
VGVVLHCCRNPVNWTPWNQSSAGLETLGPHDCKMTITNATLFILIPSWQIHWNCTRAPPMKGIPSDYSSRRNHTVVEGSPCILNAPTFAIYVNEVTANKDTRHATCLNDQVMRLLSWHLTTFMKVTQAGFISSVAFVKFLPSAFRPSLHFTCPSPTVYHTMWGHLVKCSPSILHFPT